MSTPDISADELIAKYRGENIPRVKLAFADLDGVHRGKYVSLDKFASIAGGTDEVQRNIIGERVLDLPREPDPYKGAAWDTVPRS